MPLRNKGSKDYTMQDLEKLTTVLNSYRKSAKKRLNTESREASFTKPRRSISRKSSKARSNS